MCFDKTGTLTENFMEFKNYITEKYFLMDLGMAVCHSLNEVGGLIIGDDMEIAIFEKLEAKIQGSSIIR
jgi:magnesium-transporting ATPase (P-type)